ncbi:MAG: DHH family phosphoesterase [Oscillospiraceae bacterium]|jgi:c-di-AMP phosphodiesterase-like protein|nr:DHH family phosphoesterase [Oscillospiraceae bacterium]
MEGTDRLIAALFGAAVLLLVACVLLAAALFRLRRKRKRQEAEALSPETDDPAALRRQLKRRHACVLRIALDGVDELRQELRESERVEIRAGVEALLEEWAVKHSGLLAKLADNRFLLIVLQPALEQMLQTRFPILDAVRGFTFRERKVDVTLSIGVGQGESFAECEKNSRQALELALGRGGDQAAVKNPDLSYQFFGGVSKRVEKTEKVRVRILATAFAELIKGSERVLVMGHRSGDFDCLGAAVGVCALARCLGKPAAIVMDVANSLAQPLVEHLRVDASAIPILPPKQAIAELSVKTLVIVVDTHTAHQAESPELCAQAKALAVIDHHRQAVDYLRGAVVFHHEPGASSASEMVVELLQYSAPAPKLSRVQAEALLAGIYLDTRGFLLRTAASTFEAAAWLRGRGADTVRVRRLFAGGQEEFRRRTEIVAGAKLFDHCAVSVALGSAEAGEGEGGTWRLLCAQAADELLNLEDVDAAFVLFSENEQICISARSLGARNVQRIMERMGGGGHQTMAAVQFPPGECTMEEAARRLLTALREDAEENLSGG